MKKKRIISALLICVASFMLLGCEAKDSNTKEKADNQTETSNNKAQENETTKDESTKKNDNDKTKSEDIISKDKNNDNTKNSSGEKSAEKFYGTWTISKDLTTSKQITTYSSDDIKSIIGQKLIFSKEKATAFGESTDTLKQTIESPVYKKNVISKAKFEEEWKITFKDLGIQGDSITEVNVSNSKGENTCDFLIVDDNTLILSGGGVFLQLKK